MHAPLLELNDKKETFPVLHPDLTFVEDILAIAGSTWGNVVAEALLYVMTDTSKFACLSIFGGQTRPPWCLRAFLLLEINIQMEISWRFTTKTYLTKSVPV